MKQNEESMPEELYEEEWKITLSKGGEYFLSKHQSWAVQEAIASGNRGIVMFDTFSIPVPYIAEFFRTKRFLKEERQITGKQKEEAWTDADKENASKRMRELREKLKTVVGHVKVNDFQGYEEREKREL